MATAITPCPAGEAELQICLCSREDWLGPSPRHAPSQALFGRANWHLTRWAGEGTNKTRGLRVFGIGWKRTELWFLRWVSPSIRAKVS